MNGFGRCLADHPVPGPDQKDSNKFRDKKNFHIAQASEGTTDAGEQGSNGDQPIAEDTIAAIAFARVLDG